MRSLFPLQDKSDYKLCFIFKGDCSCGSGYIGEIKRNAKVRWNEHNNPNKSSESSKHLRNNIGHCFTWTIISNSPKNAKTRKIFHILLYESLILINERTLKHWFYLEMMSHTAIN